MYNIVLVWWVTLLFQNNLAQSIPHYIQHNSLRILMLAKYIVDLITVPLNKEFGPLLSE